MSDRTLGTLIKSWIAVILALILSVCFLVSRACADTGKDKARDQKIIDEAANVKGVDCDYAVAYDGLGHVSIAVKVIKIFMDNTTKHDFLPTIYHKRKDAYGACGAWQDGIAQAHAIAIQAKQVQ